MAYCIVCLQPIWYALSQLQKCTDNLRIFTYGRKQTIFTVLYVPHNSMNSTTFFCYNEVWTNLLLTNENHCYSTCWWLHSSKFNMHLAILNISTCVNAEYHCSVWCEVVRYFYLFYLFILAHQVTVLYINTDRILY